MPHWIFGGALNLPDTMCTGFTPTGTAPKIWTQTLQNMQSGKFKSTRNAIQQWEGKGFPRVSNMEDIRNS